MYKKIINAFTTDTVDFLSARTQNIAISKPFAEENPNSIPNRIPKKNEKELGKLIAKYINCEDVFNPETFICSDVYQGSRNNGGLIEGLNPTDAYLLLAIR